ncbi:MAG: hypothetical protein ACHQZR_00475 [Candidatus Limnocylindrales bacterium]
MLVLLLNPSWQPGVDERELMDPHLRLLYRAQLSGFAPFPWHLQCWSAVGAGRYWGPLLREVAGETGPEAVATRLATVQWAAYHSATWVSPVGAIPSQTYTVRVVRHALARGALVIVARSWRKWLALVPELAHTPVIRLHTPRRPYLTPGNMGQEGYQRLLAALEAR